MNPNDLPAHRYQAEALARLAAYQRVTCTAERWDRMLALLDLAYDELDCQCEEQVGECARCQLRVAIEKMLGDAR